MTSRLQVRSVRRVLAALAVATIGSAAGGQTVGNTSGRIRPCGAASCEDVAALVTSLDTVLRASTECAGHQVRVAAELYWHPFAFDERSKLRDQPSEPAIGKWGDVV